jgi:hypothetical protein
LSDQKEEELKNQVLKVDENNSDNEPKFRINKGNHSHARLTSTNLDIG